MEGYRFSREKLFKLQPPLFIFFFEYVKVLSKILAPSSKFYAGYASLITRMSH